MLEKYFHKLKNTLITKRTKQSQELTAIDNVGNELVRSEDNCFYTYKGKKEYIINQIIKLFITRGILEFNDIKYNDEEYKSDSILGIFINSSDIFGWGYSDSDPVNENDLIQIYEMFKISPKYGDIKFICKKYDQKPQHAYVIKIKEAKEWDDMMESLKDNKN